MEYIDKIRVNNTDYNIAVPNITLDSGGKITSISMPTGSITCFTISATHANLETIEKIQFIKLVSNLTDPHNNFFQLGCRNITSDIILEARVGTTSKVSNFSWAVTPDGNDYDITVPNKSGTLALTSDLDNIDLTTAAGTYYRFSPGPIYKSCVYIEPNGSLHYAQFTGSGINIPAGAVLLNVEILS